MFGKLVAHSMDSMINVFLKTRGMALVNGRIARYGEVTELRKEGPCYHARVRLQGHGSDLEVTMKGLEMDEGCTVARLGEFSASEPWLEHLLEDHANGRRIPSPEGARPALRPFAKYV